MKLKLKLFLTAEFSCFIFLFIYLFMFNRGSINYFEVLFFAFILFFSNNISLLINSGKEILTSIILPILMPAMVVLPPFWVAIIAIIGTVEIRQLKNFYWDHFIFNRTMFFIATGTAALIYKSSIQHFSKSCLFISLLFAAGIYFLINNSLVFFVVRISSGKKDSSLLIYYIELLKSLIPSYFLGLILCYGYEYFGKIIFVLGIILIYILKDFLYSHLQQLNSFTQIVESFLKVIDSKDHYTEGHCKRVAEYTYLLCKEAGLRRTKLEQIVNMAKIHDIGKINISDKILKSSDRLTDEQYDEMKKHCEYGYNLLQDIDLLRRDLDIVLYHHEKYDGSGYPEGKKGTAIPLGARILSICDAFDVMTTGRSYKDALTREEILLEFEKCAGRHFDPELTASMVKLINNGFFDDSFGEETDCTQEQAKDYQLSINSAN